MSKFEEKILGMTRITLFLLITSFLSSFSVYGQEEIFREDWEGEGVEGITFPDGWIQSPLGSGNWYISKQDEFLNIPGCNISGSSEGNFLAVTNFASGGNYLTYDLELSTMDVTDLMVSWNAYKENEFSPNVVFQWSRNGNDWNIINYTDVQAHGIWESISNIQLPSTAENVERLRLRFSYISDGTFSNYYAIDDLLIMGNRTTGGIYYSKNTGFLNDLTTWGTEIDGSGDNPTSFSINNTQFIVLNNPNPTLNSSMDISGSGTKLIVGDGIQPIHLTIPSAHTITGSVNVRSYAAVTVQNPTRINFGEIEDETTIIYNSILPQEIASSNYYNLTLEESVKTFYQSPLETTIRNDLRIEEGSLLSFPTSPLGYTLKLHGQISGAGTISSNTSNINVIIEGSGGFGPIYFTQNNEAVRTIRTLTLNRNGNVNLGSDLFVTNSIKIDKGALHVNGNTLKLNGPVTGTSLQLITNTSSNLEFGGGTLLLNIPTSVTVLNHLIIGKTTGVVRLQNHIELYGVLNVNSTSQFNAGAFEISGPGSIDISGTVLTAHTNGYTGTFQNTGTHTLSPASTINYNGGTQIISPTSSGSYGHLILSGSGTKTANGIIPISGNFINTTATFAPGSSTIEFVGNVTRTLSVNQFHHLTFASSAPSSSSWTGNLNLTGNLLVQNENTINVPSGTVINIAGNWENNGNIQMNNNTVNFNGGNQSISGNTTFAAVNMTGSNTKSIDGEHTLNELNVDENVSVDAGSSTLTLAGNFTNNGTFIPGTGTVIFNGDNTLLPNTATFDFNNITINNVLNSSSVIQITGNWSNSGTFNHNDGKVIFAGGLEQTIPNSTEFYDLEVNKTGSSLNLTGPVQIFNVLKLQSGTLNTNGQLTLVSTPDLTARIDKVENGATLDGEVLIERTIARNKIGYYYLGTSIKEQTLQSWMDDFWVQGVDAKYPNAFKNVSNYNEATRSWVPVTSQNEPIIPGVGYKVLMYESNFTTGSMTFDNKGEPVIGNGVDGSINFENDESFEFNLSYTNNDNNPQSSGFNFLSNPYPSDIYWDNEGWNASQIDGSLYIWDGENFVYKTLLMDGSGDEIEKIASGQGFFVRATGPDASLRITENAKTGGATFFRKKAPENVIKLSLVDPNGRKDNTYVRLHQEGTTDFDIGLDAYKLKGDLNIFTKNEHGHHHAINTSALIKKDTTINIYTTVSKAGTYNINLSGLNSFKDETQIWMKDNLLGKTLLVGDDFQYSFTISNEDKNKEINRFELIFNRLRVELAGFISDKNGSALPQATISLYQNDELISKVTSDENGKYSFHVAPHQSYQLFAEFHGNNMIQVEDMYTLVKSLNTQLPDANTDQFVAFDLDNSDQIDQHDLKVLVDAYLGIQQLQNSHQLISTNGNNKFFQIMPDTDIDDLTFVAIPKGQLHDDPFVFSNDPLELAIEQLNNPNNDLLQVNLVFDNKSILAYQLKLKWDPAKITFRDISSADLQFTVNDETGELFLFNYSKTIPTLYFDILAIGEEINIQVLAESNALNADFAMVGFSPRKKNVLGNSDHQLSLFKVSPVYPNPVRESGTIAFFIPEPDEVSFVIHDVNGVIIEETRKAFPQGENQLHWINGKNLKSGVYLWKIIYKNEVLVQKMVIQ